MGIILYGDILYMSIEEPQVGGTFGILTGILISSKWTMPILFGIRFNILKCWQEILFN